jgi:hypothetical protein
VASGCIPEATLLPEAIRGPEPPVENPPWKPTNTSTQAGPVGNTARPRPRTPRTRIPDLTAAVKFAWV